MPISDNDDQIRLQFPQLGNEMLIARFRRLQDGQIEILCQDFHLRRLKFQLASLGFVRLGDDGDDMRLRRTRKSLEAGAGQFRCAHENNF